MSLLPREETEGSERRLRRSDKRFLLGCVVAAAITLAVGFYLYPKVNPEASIRFEVSRPASEKVAEEFLRRIGSDVQRYRHAARFSYDDESKVFLERALGADEANRLMSADVRMWRWGHRWFRPLQKEEVSVEVATTGEIAAFDHQIPEEAEGAHLSQEDARGLAERFLSGVLNAPLDSLEFLEAKTEERPHRTDHTFTWKRVGRAWQGGDYRLETRIQGDSPGAYREFVHIPESWSRDYARLRSKNTGAAVVASVLLLLSILAMVVVLVNRVRLHDVRWRTAGIFAAIGASLQILAGLNSLPSAFYDYDTTASFGGFLITHLFAIFGQGLVLGVAIFVFTAAGETLYREAYPGKISLTGFFTLRGLRTRRFLLSTVLGLTLTCFFFFYQEVFYTVARRLGAWAPMEVPYDDLLNTAFPWVFILLVGFMPAVTEEFLSRMFSIPFFRRITRSGALAIVIPAFIWGFGHSAYPNQPFFIRGLEVGIAGILIGIVMVRMNIVATLVWHFTVDALYTSTILFRSHNVYYVVSAALAGGVILIPLGYAVVSYLRRGGFEEPEDLLNRSEPGPAVGPESVERDVLESPWAGTYPAVPAGRGTLERPEPASPADLTGISGVPERIPMVFSSVPWSRRRRLGGVLAAGGSLLLLLLPAAELKLPDSLRLSRRQAKEHAVLEARSLGESADSFRTLILFGTREEEAEAKYLLQHGGVERLREEYARVLPPRFWSARFFRPLETREMQLSLDSGTGRLLTLERHIAEKDSLPSMDPSAAEALARGFLASQGVNMDSLELKEASEEKRPRRLDHTFVWEAREGDPRNAGAARHRIHVGIQGNQVGSFDEELKLPEDWVRSREKSTAVQAIRMILLVVAGSAVFGLILWRWIADLRSGRIRWRPILMASIPFAVFSLIAGVNSWPLMIDRYETTYPWSVYMVVVAVGLIVRTLMGALIAVVSLSLVTAVWPAAWSLRSASVRRRMLPDALLAGLAGVAIVVVLQHLEAVALRLWPALASVPSLSRPIGTSSLLPWIGIAYTAVQLTLLAVGVLGGILGLFQIRRIYPRWTAGLVALCVVALVPLEAKTGGEFAIGLVWSAVEIAVFLLVARWLFSGNLLAMPLMVYLLAVLRGVWPFLQADGEFFRMNGLIAAGLLALPLLWLLWPRRLEPTRGDAR